MELLKMDGGWREVPWAGLRDGQLCSIQLRAHLGGANFEWLRHTRPAS